MNKTDKQDELDRLIVATSSGAITLLTGSFVFISNTIHQVKASWMGLIALFLSGTAILLTISYKRQRIINKSIINESPTFKNKLSWYCFKLGTFYTIEFIAYNLITAMEPSDPITKMVQAQDPLLAFILIPLVFVLIIFI